MTKSNIVEYELQRKTGLKIVIVFTTVIKAKVVVTSNFSFRERTKNVFSKYL